MKLREEILKQHSKAQTDRIVEYIGKDAERFAELMGLFFQGEHPLTQRAAWPMSYVALKHPELYKPYLERAVQFLKQPGIHDSVLRNTLRILQDLPIPEHLQGELVDICLGYLIEPKKPSAIKAFAIATLQNICKQHPELAQEVKTVLAERMEYEKPAFLSRAKRFVKAF